MSRDGRSKTRADRIPAGVRSQRRGGEGGFALPAALWLAAIVSMIGGAMLLLSNTQTRVATAELETRQARHLAEGAARLAALRLADGDALFVQALAEGRAVEMTVVGGTARIQISYEEDRLDLNAAEPADLQALLVEAGVEARRADRVAAAVADFRDPDDLRRLNGAEAAEYRAAGLAHEPANRPFRHPSELSLVLGVDAQIAGVLAERGTVWVTRPGPLLTRRLEEFWREAVEPDAAAGFAAAPFRSDRLLVSAGLEDGFSGEDFLGEVQEAYRLRIDAETSETRRIARLEVVVAPSLDVEPPFHFLERRFD